MDTRWPRNSLFVRAFKIIKVKRFNAVTEEMRESEDSMQMAAQDARRLSFAARRNKLEMETLSEEKEKIKEKKKDVFIPFAYSCYGVLPIRQNFSWGNGGSPLFYFRSIHLLARRNAPRDEAGEPRKLHRRLYAEGSERAK